VTVPGSRRAKGPGDDRILGKPTPVGLPVLVFLVARPTAHRFLIRGRTDSVKARSSATRRWGASAISGLCKRRSKMIRRQRYRLSRRLLRFALHSRATAAEASTPRRRRPQANARFPPVANSDKQRHKHLQRCPRCLLSPGHYRARIEVCSLDELSEEGGKCLYPLTKKP
jgi:hypothetical protein